MVPDAVNKVVSIIKGDTAENKVDPEVEAAVNKAAQAESSVVDVADCHSLPQTAKYGIPFPAPSAETYDLRFRYLFVHVALL